MAPQSSMIVRELMTAKVQTAAPTDAVEDVYRLMQLAGIRHVPVIDEDKLVGIVSDRDVFVAWGSGGRTPVAQVMTKSPRWVRPETPVHEAAATMLRHKIGCLPVVDGELRVVGIVTETDFVALAQRMLLTKQVLAEAPAP